MASEHDLDLVARIRAGTAVGVLGADDPAAVADAVGDADGVRCTEVDALGCAIVAARVRLAEVVVDRARRGDERSPVRVVGAETAPTRDAPEDTADDGPDADRQAVRFSLVILVLALVGGTAVYLADGLVLAPALPAAALVVLAAVVLAHRRPATGLAEAPSLPAVEETATAPVHVDVDDTPAVRAAQAHLRRQQAAWKVTWWERDEPVPDIGTWSPAPSSATSITLVAVDRDGEVDEGAHATMTATAPAAVRVVVLQARG